MKTHKRRKKSFPVMIGIRLTENENTRLRVLCDSEKRRISDLVREIIRDWLAARD